MFLRCYRSEIHFAISPNISERQANLEYKALAVGRFAGAAGRQPETNSVDTFRVLERKEQHIVPNVSLAFQFI